MSGLEKRESAAILGCGFEIIDEFNFEEFALGIAVEILHPSWRLERKARPNAQIINC